MKITFVKGQISVSFCFILFFVKSAEWSGIIISAGHSLLPVPFQFQENHQNRDLLAFVPAAVKDDHLVNIRHLSKMMVPP
jgi:hypothetical protein